MSSFLRILISVLMRSYYRPQRSWGKVIFSEACVKNSVRLGGGVEWVWPIACWDTPPDLRQASPRDQASPGPEAGTPPGTRHPPRPGTPQRSACWEIRATSGRYASYWNINLVLFVGLLMPLFGLLVTSALGFKARMDPSLMWLATCMQWMSQIHLGCNTWWPFDSEQLFWSMYFHSIIISNFSFP